MNKYMLLILIKNYKVLTQDFDQNQIESVLSKKLLYLYSYNLIASTIKK